MPIEASQIARDHQKRGMLTDLREAHQRGVPVIGVPAASEHRDAAVLRPEQGPADAGDPIWAMIPFDLTVAHDLVTGGYVEMDPPNAGGVYKFRLTGKGMSVVRDAGDGLNADQRWLMQTIWDHFRERADWPLYYEVQRRLRDLDVEEVAKSLPPGYINAHNAADSNYNRGRRRPFPRGRPPVRRLR